MGRPMASKEIEFLRTGSSPRNLGESARLVSFPNHRLPPPRKWLPTRAATSRASVFLRSPLSTSGEPSGTQVRLDPRDLPFTSDLSSNGPFTFSLHRVN